MRLTSNHLRAEAARPAQVPVRVARAWIFLPVWSLLLGLAMSSQAAAPSGEQPSKPLQTQPAELSAAQPGEAAVKPPAMTLEAGLALAKQKNCMACHQVDSRRVGPPLASVAARYGTASGLTDYLAETIRRGGRGRWGAVPMPAQPQVSHDEAVALANWILSLPVAPPP